MQAPPRQTQVQSVRFRFAGRCSIEQCSMDSVKCERNSRRRMPLFYFKTLKKKEQKEIHT